MSSPASVFKLCSITGTETFCDPATNTQIQRVNVVDAQGALIPTSSTAYPATAAVDGPVFGGIGFVRSYWADASGVVLGTQPTALEESKLKPGSCPPPDVLLGERVCVVNDAGQYVNAVPYSTWDGTQVSPKGWLDYYSMAPLTGSVTVELDPCKCPRIDCCCDPVNDHHVDDHDDGAADHHDVDDHLDDDFHDDLHDDLDNHDR